VPDAALRVRPTLIPKERLQEKEMRQRILGLAGGRRRRRLLLAVVASAAALGVFAITSALAVHDEEFQLDGNVIDDAGPPQDFDWANFFNSAGAELPLPPNFTASSFDRDFSTNPNGSFSTSDNTTFATGSKDTLAITPGWQCNQDNNVLSKNDIMNAYATSYEDPVSGDEILYFALERNANTGTADVGFWFLQDDNVNCESPGGSTPFTGDHTDGDLLVVAEFTQGGTVSTIQVYRWEGGANGSLNENPVASGVDCRTTAGGDTVCGRVNLDTITTPWQTANKQDGVGNSLRVSEFFEAGLNLTDSGLGNRCFNVFLADTRSSTSLTATLFDFSRGQLGQCQSFTTTTPKQADGTTDFVSPTPIPAMGRLEVRDSALIEVDGVDTFDGEVTFFLCGPAELTTAGEVCDPDDGNVGVQIGNPVGVTSTPSTVVSDDDAAFLTSAGRYCWRAEFSGDDTVGVPPSEDASLGECFTVTPLQPTLVTDATDSPVPFGETITDVVTLAGTANQEGTDGPVLEPTINATRGGGAGGTISVTVFGPDSCSTIAHGPVTLNVNGDGSYGGAGSALEFEPTAPGEYVFVASYSGDDPNTLGVAAAACADQPSNERVTVEQIPTDIITRQSWFPNDTATVSATAGNLAAGGKVLFELFTNATCDGTAVYSEEVDVPGGSPSAEVGTSNDGTSPTDYEITTEYDDPADSTVGRHSWRVTYTPAAADTAHTGSRSTCDSEHFNITYTNDNTGGVDLP
jgi:hypothetical protein